MNNLNITSLSVHLFSLLPLMPQKNLSKIKNEEFWSYSGAHVETSKYYFTSGKGQQPDRQKVKIAANFQTVYAKHFLLYFFPQTWMSRI